MLEKIKGFRHSLILKIIIAVGVTLILSIFAWSFFVIKYQEKNAMENVVAEADRLSKTIKLGTHYAMMINSRDDIKQIIKNISRQPEIKNIRIYNKGGRITYSNQDREVNKVTNIKAEACYVCHRTEPPQVHLDLSERTRIFNSSEEYRLLGVLSPIYNEPGCSADPCHVHPEDKKILGALDVVISLEDTDHEMAVFQSRALSLAVFVFFLTALTIFTFLFKFVKQPIKKLIASTKLIAKGGYFTQVDINREDEIGQLASSINQMGREIGEKQQELNQQRDEYQQLFETVPCIITVQDRDYRLINYNREFKDKFSPSPDDFCYHAYKGRDTKCEDCPVEKTFSDGLPHVSEETGINKEGQTRHWIVTTSPIKNAEGEVVAAMEVSLDITQRKQLEEKLEASEKKYHAIFANIPNPVFVLDKNTFEILGCNDSVTSVYGYSKETMKSMSFLDLFKADDREFYANKLKTSNVINQAKHFNKDGGTLYVDIRISPSEYPGQEVLLVTTSDITKRLEAEQQLIQASKMATLGEMATGVAHELNQPLSVIKTASNFFINKIEQNQPIKEEIMETMCREIDGYVNRATKIINHLREFGRKSDLSLEHVRLNSVITKAFDIFSQQLKLREIEVDWQLGEDIPDIMGDPSSLEQVFINLLINARDAIEDRWAGKSPEASDKKISLRTYRRDDTVIAEVEDTGTGIPKAILEKLFEPFFTTKEVGKGTGLGLSISYGIIKDSGGRIEAFSKNGEGAKFVITFPAVKE